MSDCAVCDGECAGSDLAPLLDRRLHWLWQQIAAAADRRGDRALANGTLRVAVPAEAEYRAAAAGLLGSRRQLVAGQRRTLDLADLTVRLAVRGAALTPGAVAAHATGRRLATRSEQRAARAAREQHLRSLTGRLLNGLPPGRLAADPIQVWAAFAANSWSARLLDMPNAEQLLHQAVRVLAALPDGEQRMDRRRLADSSGLDPHALDHNAQLARLIIAILTAAGRVPAQSRPRDAWAAVGVDCDMLLGGLITLGVHPHGWTLPPAAVSTVPPRELATCRWPAPPRAASWVFLTENPSVISAAADLAAHTDAPIRLLCTAGTPSTVEVDAVGRLAEAGWQVAVRADFDEAGLRHVTALLDGVPTAVPWRMCAADYAAVPGAVDPDTASMPLDPARLPCTPWDPALADLMRTTGRVVYEETLLPALLHDLHSGQPESGR